MENVTNKTLLTTMIIVGVVIVLMIIPLYPKSYISTRNLGATAFINNEEAIFENNAVGINLNTNYPVSAFRTSNTRTITSTTEVPTTTTETYYYTTYESNDLDYQGYVPSGCESGTDYSLTTGEPCG